MKLELLNGKMVWRFDCTIDIAHSIPRHTTGGPLPIAHNRNDGMVRDRWRLLSAVEAWPTSAFYLPQLVDYGHNNGEVLKDIIPLVNQNKPDLTWNHSIDAHDVAGYIENAAWEQSKDIPVGVNADLVVDPSYDEKAAHGLRNGIIRNGSIAISMQLEKSHPNIDFDDFVQKQGEIIEGKKCRWLPIKIDAVHHMAIVAAGTGADPNAGKRTAANVGNTRRSRIDVVDRAVNQVCNRMFNENNGLTHTTTIEDIRRTCNTMFCDNEDSEVVGHSNAFAD